MLANTGFSARPDQLVEGGEKRRHKREENESETEKKNQKWQKRERLYTATRIHTLSQVQPWVKKGVEIFIILWKSESHTGMSSREKGVWVENMRERKNKNENEDDENETEKN